MPGAATTQVNMKKVSAVIYPPYTKIEKVGKRRGYRPVPPCAVASPASFLSLSGL